MGLRLRVLRLGGGWHGRGEWVRVRVRVRVRLDLSAALAPVERWPDALAQPLRILLELVQQLVLLAGVDGALVGLVVDVLHHPRDELEGGAPCAQPLLQLQQRLAW